MRRRRRHHHHHHHAGQRHAADGCQYAGWGLHLWGTNGIDTTRLPFPASALAQWDAPVALSAMPNYTVGANEVVFDVPVLNPKDDAQRTGFTFLVHGMGGAGNPARAA